MNLVAARFRDVPILAEKAAHIASGGAHRKDSGAGKKMIERLFFDRVDLNRGGRCVAETVKLAALIDADEAEAGLTVSDMAMARAKVAMHLAVGIDVPPAGFVERRGFLEDVETAHCARPGASKTCADKTSILYRLESKPVVCFV